MKINIAKTSATNDVDKSLYNIDKYSLGVAALQVAKTNLSFVAINFVSV